MKIARTSGRVPRSSCTNFGPDKRAEQLDIETMLELCQTVQGYLSQSE